MPSLERPLARSQRSSDPRIGLPDTVVRARGNARNDASNVVPMRCDHPASSRFTRPGTALPSQMYTGTRATRAAITMGSDTRPPVVQQTDGPKRTICARASTAANGSSNARETSEIRESGSRSDGITVAWNGMPAAETSSASRPRRPPRKRKSTSGSAALVAEHGEDRIGVGRGKEAEFLPAGPEPLAERTAEGEAIQRLDGLESSSAWIRPGIDESEQALVPIWLYDRGGKREDDRERAECRELAQPRARDEVHRERDRHDDERRAEIGLDEHEPADGGGHRKEGHGHPPAADLGTMRTEPGAEIEDDRELRELRWLDADERPEPQPACSSARAGADARNEDRDEERDRQREQRDRDDAQAAMLDARRDQHRREAQRGPRRLLREVGARIVVGVERRHAARAVDHRESQQEQREDDDEQRDVIRGGARQSRWHEATGSANARTSAVKRSPRPSADEN